LEGGAYGTAEGVIGGTLSQCFAADAIILCTKGVCDVVGSLEGVLGFLLPVEDMVIVEELDVQDEKWGCAGGLGSVFTWMQKEEEGNACHVGCGCGTYRWGCGGHVQPLVEDFERYWPNSVGHWIDGLEAPQ